MPQNIKSIPEGYHTLTPHLVVKNATQAIDFYKRAFGATESSVMRSPDGKHVVHAELKIGDSPFMLGEEMEGMPHKSVETMRGSPVGFYVYVQDVDQSFQKAIAAGGKETMKLENMFWGDRTGTLVDPFGFQWTIATQKEKLSNEEIEKRGKEFFAKKKGETKAA